MTEQEWENLFEAIARVEPGKGAKMDVPNDFWEPANLQRFQDEMNKRYVPDPPPPSPVTQPFKKRKS